MINWSIEYTLSQILIVIAYILICKTYFLKNRGKILITNVFAHIFQFFSFIILNGLTGSAMTIVYIVRDSFFYIDNQDKKDNFINKRDYIILFIFILIIILFTFLTYDGLFSLFSVFATIISTIAIWQKKTKYYKMLGIPVSIFWLGYYIFLQSLFAIILESVLLTSIIIGFIMELNNKHK